eukprot:TRINITY_DN75456_c0_g1_i1.p1 TRINITY_DN75456_c0_g1~~TRINITY_DN75456_c0_g1_i1.p1  ORF type:complete len:358 (+),score=86.74 TRINITY_DN75456_c0_g1_i1:140-1213(+)
MVLLRASAPEALLADEQWHTPLVVSDPGAHACLHLRHAPGLRHPRPSVCTAFDVSSEKAEMLREEIKAGDNGKLQLTQEGEELGNKVNPQPEIKKKGGMFGSLGSKLSDFGNKMKSGLSNLFGGGKQGKLREKLDDLKTPQKKKAARGEEEQAPVLDEKKTEKAELTAALKGEGQQPPPVASEVTEQQEADAEQKQEDAGEDFEPPDKEGRKRAALPPEARLEDFYTFTAARLARRSRQAALIADNAVMEAWRQQQYARYWSRQAQELEQAALKAVKSCAPKAGEEASSRWQQLPVPPGWELPPTPLVSTRDPRAVNIYSLSVGPAGLLSGSCYPFDGRNRREGCRELGQRQASSFL